MSGGVYAAKKDSLSILGSIYEYHKTHKKDIKGFNDNFYVKYNFNVERRNVALWLIPHMYPLAKDPREYVAEVYNNITFTDKHSYNINRQAVLGTIRKNRKTMPTLRGGRTMPTLRKGSG